MARNTQHWRLRLRIYGASGSGTELVLQADTHPDDGEETPLNDEIVAEGHMGVMEEVSAIIHGYHGAPPETIEGARLRDLVRRIGTLRTYLSAHGGRTTIKLPYTPDHATSWHAVATVERRQ